MQFSYTILYVRDVLQAVAFYEQALGLKQRFIDESERYAEMATETTTLAFATHDLASSNLPQGYQASSLSNLPAGIEIGLVIDDVAGAYQRAIAAGATAVVEPKVKPWGQTVAYVRDLDGVLVSINSPM